MHGPRTAASARCAAAGRAAAHSAVPDHAHRDSAAERRSHDLNPLETAFAQLQAMMGNHFLYHFEEVSRQKIVEKIG